MASKENRTNLLLAELVVMVKYFKKSILLSPNPNHPHLTLLFHPSLFPSCFPSSPLCLYNVIMNQRFLTNFSLIVIKHL